MINFIVTCMQRGLNWQQNKSQDVWYIFSKFGSFQVFNDSRVSENTALTVWQLYHKMLGYIYGCLILWLTNLWTLSTCLHPTHPYTHSDASGYYHFITLIYTCPHTNNSLGVDLALRDRRLAWPTTRFKWRNFKLVYFTLRRITHNSGAVKFEMDHFVISNKLNNSWS